MKLDNCISERINKKIYRDGNKCIKLFDEVYSKADVLTKLSTMQESKKQD